MGEPIEFVAKILEHSLQNEISLTFKFRRFSIGLRYKNLL